MKILSNEYLTRNPLDKNTRLVFLQRKVNYYAANDQ